MTALRLADAGWRVVLVGASDGSASAVAAGMLAPASEAVLDDASPAQAAALLKARALWTPLAHRFGIALDTAGTLHVDTPDRLGRRAAWARALGFTCAETVVDVGGTVRLALALTDDAVLEPLTALAAIEAALTAQGVERVEGVVTAADGRLWMAGEALAGPCIVAAGWGSYALAPAAPELAALHPIKGQLLRFAGTAAGGPTLRAPHVYLAPQPGGWVAGATMEPGRTDLSRNPAALAALRAAAAELRPELADAPAEAAVGVRAAMEDESPLVGPSRSGVWLATGLRRNGWLLAPLVAEGIAAYLDGRDPDAALAGQALAWSPARVAP